MTLQYFSKSAFSKGLGSIGVLQETDVIKLTLSEVTSVKIETVLVDTNIISISEEASVMVFIATNDTLLFNISELVFNILVSQEKIDDIVLTSSEERFIAVSNSSSDPPVIYVQTDVNLTSIINVNDNLSCILNENINTIIDDILIDSLVVNLQESNELLYEIAVSDNLIIELNQEVYIDHFVDDILYIQTNQFNSLIVNQLLIDSLIVYLNEEINSVSCDVNTNDNIYMNFNEITSIFIDSFLTDFIEIMLNEELKDIVNILNTNDNLYIQFNEQSNSIINGLLIDNAKTVIQEVVSIIALNDQNEDDLSIVINEFAHVVQEIKVKDNLLWQYRPPYTDNIALHYDANGIIDLNNNDKVALWEDLSINKKHAIQNNITNQPTYIKNGINGLPVIRFNKSVNPQFLNTQFIPNGGAVFIVNRPHTPSQSGTIKGLFGFSGNPRYYLGLNNVNQLISGYGNSYLGSVETFGNNINYLFSMNFTNERARIFDLSTQKYNYSATFTGQNANILAIGNITSVANASFNGDIAEIVVYNTPLSTLEHQAVVDYLNAKWGIDQTLYLDNILNENALINVTHDINDDILITVHKILSRDFSTQDTCNIYLSDIAFFALSSDDNLNISIDYIALLNLLVEDNLNIIIDDVGILNLAVEDNITINLDDAVFLLNLLSQDNLSIDLDIAKALVNSLFQSDNLKIYLEDPYINTRVLEVNDSFNIYLSDLTLLNLVLNDDLSININEFFDRVYIAEKMFYPLQIDIITGAKNSLILKDSRTKIEFKRWK